MPGLFEPTTINGMALKNRFVRSATWEGMAADGGTSTPALEAMMAELAAGEPEAYCEAAARRFKETMGIPLVLVGGIRAFETAERLVAEGATDYVAPSRPLIREPRLIERWQAGDTAPARCVRDNGCFDTPDEVHGLFCAVAARKARRACE